MDTLSALEKMKALRICSQILGKICDHWENEEEEWAEVVKCLTEQKAMFITNLIQTAIRPCLPAEVEFGIFQADTHWEVSLSYNKNKVSETMTIVESSQNHRKDN